MRKGLFLEKVLESLGTGKREGIQRKIKKFPKIPKIPKIPKHAQSLKAQQANKKACGWWYAGSCSFCRHSGKFSAMVSEVPRTPMPYSVPWPASHSRGGQAGTLYSQ